MSSSLQTIIALGLVVLAATGLIYSAVKKRGKSGCGGGACSAVSPEIRKLQSRLKS